MVKSRGSTGSVVLFFDLANMILGLSANNVIEAAPSSYRLICAATFEKCLEAALSAER